LLYALDIEMDVDEEEYMEEWKKERELKGVFHEYGKLSLLPATRQLIASDFYHSTENQYLYSVAVRDSPGSSTTECVESFDGEDNAFDYRQEGVKEESSRDISPMSGESAENPLV